MTACSRAATVALHHIGCRLNQAEIEALADHLRRRGFGIVPFAGQADVYVINTCTVTRAGDADSRRAVRRARLLNPEATVVATGCYAQRRPDELRGAGADLVLGNGDKSNLVQCLENHLEGRSQAPAAALGTGRFLPIEGAVPHGRTRGALQVQDGCSEHCTYCVIPSVRGPSVSRPLAQVVAQARVMVDSGYRELHLTGVNTGAYGRDRDGAESLAGLLKALLQVDNLLRVRLGSVEPREVSEALIDLVADSPRVCRHFHVPLQSGDDDVLRRMGRRYTAAGYAERLVRVAHAVPDCAIGADVLVGFPGETEAAFANTVALIRQLPLTYLHVFPYSVRQGTPASRWSDAPPPAVTRARVQELIELGQGRRQQFHQGFVGRLLGVLVEDQRDGVGSGLSDNYVKATFAGVRTLPNALVTVRVTQADTDGVRAEVLP